MDRKYEFERLSDESMFNAVFERLKESYKHLDRFGYIICWKGQEMFSIEGYNLAYNLYRLGNLLNDMGEFR